MYQLRASHAHRVLTSPSSRASDCGLSSCALAAAYSSNRLGVSSAMAMLPTYLASLPSRSLCQAFETWPSGACAMYRSRGEQIDRFPGAIVLRRRGHLLRARAQLVVHPVRCLVGSYIFAVASAELIPPVDAIALPCRVDGHQRTSGKSSPCSLLSPAHLATCATTCGHTSLM